MNNMELWDNVKLPPKDACKTITGGRMNGKTDINPIWRIQALTEHFGMCGIGWYYDIIRLWNENGTENQVLSFAEIKLYIKVNGEWSKGISGTGGNMMVTKEKTSMHNSDECYKMAITDALSVSCKMLGFGAVIYGGMKDFETKYENVNDEPKTNKKDSDVKNNQIKADKTKELIEIANPVKDIIPEQLKNRLRELAKENGLSLSIEEYKAMKEDLLLIRLENKAEEIK